MRRLSRIEGHAADDAGRQLRRGQRAQRARIHQPQRRAPGLVDDIGDGAPVGREIEALDAPAEIGRQHLALRRWRRSMRTRRWNCEFSSESVMMARPSGVNSPPL